MDQIVGQALAMFRRINEQRDRRQPQDAAAAVEAI
jgi:hypothetical protein